MHNFYAKYLLGKFHHKICNIRPHKVYIFSVYIKYATFNIRYQASNQAPSSATNPYKNDSNTFDA